MNSNYREYIFSKSKLNFQILDAIVDLVRIINDKNEVIYVNKAMKDVLGHDDEKYLCEIDQSILNPYITKRTLETGEVIQREEMIGENQFSVKCSPIIGSEGEILGVVEVFRNISTETRLLNEIMDKNKSMTIEMNQAQKIQNTLLPEKGFLENINVNYFYKPSNKLSGDMFDVFKINEDNYAVYIADSVGHGFAASMVTMFIRFVMRTLTKNTLLTPSKTIKELWTRFCTLNLDIELYFTFFYGVYNRKSSKFIFSNAGHYPSPIFVSDGEVKELEISGYPISRIFSEVEYEDYEVELKVSDKLLFMTDGLVDTRNVNKEEYGIERVKSILSKNQIDELKTLRDSVYKFMWQEQKDDITALLLKVW